MKYFSKKVTFQGIEFDSTQERDRYLTLLQLQKDGFISSLRRQVPFILIPRITHTVPKHLKTKTRYIERTLEKEARYHADFVYRENGCLIVEEFKSAYTAHLADYILRRKLMVQKIASHNARHPHTPAMFREVVYRNKRTPPTVTDRPPFEPTLFP